MLSPESMPSERYMRLFDEACRANNARMARDCLRLASLIAQRSQHRLAIVSLARAGTPVGVVVTRLLRELFGNRLDDPQRVLELTLALGATPG